MIKEKEVWRRLDFMGYPNYEVSNMGDVWSLNYGTMSENRVNKYGYRRVRLYKDGKRKEFLVHRLVAFAFVDNPNKEEWNIVNHKDENKLNNRADNLEWCDTAYNVTYGTCVERRVATKFKNGTWNCDELKEINRKPVYKYNFEGNIVERFISQTESYRIDRVGSSMLKSDIPIRNGCFYSYDDNITKEKIWDSIYNFKHEHEKNVRESMIKAYQYDFDCNLVDIHEDINRLVMDISSIKACLDGEKKFYNKYIWSGVELDKSVLQEMVNDIMNYRKIYSYNVDSLEMREYENIDQVESMYSKNRIRVCCNNVLWTHVGNIWSYTELSKDELNKTKDIIITGNKKRVYQYNLLGDFIKEWESIDDCVKAGYTKTGLHDCFNEISYQHNGYIWSKYKLSQSEIESKIEDVINNTTVRPLYQYTKDLELVKAWSTTTEAGRYFSISPISECCRGIRRKSYKGYIWSYRKIK